MLSIILLIKSILFIVNLILIKSKSYSLSDDAQLNINKTSNNFNINNTCEKCFQKKLFLPEYQNKYSRINELNDTNFNFMRIKSNRSVTLVPENLIDGNEKLLEIEKISNIINKIEKNNNGKKMIKNQDEIYNDDYSFYSDTNSFYNDYDNFAHKYIKKNTLIYEKSSSSIKDIISTNPDKIKIEYEICKPKSVTFRIVNPNLEENLVIKSIKSDLYQVKIFPIVPPNKNSYNNIINNKMENLIPSIDAYLEHTVYPQSTFIFQLLLLLDHKTTIKGTLYIEFNEKKVLLIPIQLKGKENSHRINPIYYLNYQIRKPLYVPIQIFNPTTKTLIITEIIHPFEKIKVYWPSDELFNNNISTVSHSMLEIEPMSYKKVFFLKYYSSRIETEYGFIHLRTQRGVIVIPVLINFVNSPILTHPQSLNFGLCDVTPKSRNNFIRMIPLRIINDGVDYIKIGKVYIDYDELFLQFHQNFGGENIVIKPNDEVTFGYVIFNANLEKDLEKLLIKKKNFFGKTIKKLIYIETNSTNTPLVEIEYSYMSYINNELQEISGNVQSIPKSKDGKENFSFVTNIKFRKPIKLRIYNSYSPGENITIYSDKYMNAKIANPSNEYQIYDSNIIIEIEKISKFRNYHYYYLPLRLNQMLFTIIPIQIDNNDLTKIYCGSEENSRTLSICMKNLRPDDKINTIKGSLNRKKIFDINFGNVPQSVKKQKFIYLINENESPIPINNIIIDYSNVNFLIDFEGYEYFGNGDEPSNIKYPKKGDLLEEIQNIENNESISFKIYPNTAAKFSINLITNENTLNNIRGTITFYYGEEYKFILSLNATIIKGNINLSPVIYKFEPSFPGLYQKKIIYTKSTFNFPLNILSVTSSDERIIPQLLINKINPKNRTAVIEVNFDPSKTNFIKEDLNQFELNMSNILTYRELYLWKAKEKFFNKLGSTGRTEINANVTITTSLDKGDINFKSFLIKPNLSKKEEIDFGLIQIGKPVSVNVEGINPSDKMLLIKLILADDDYGDVNNNSMFNEKDRNLLEQNNDLIIFGCNFLMVINSTSISKNEYIVVPEKIDPIELRRGTFNKKDLLKILYKYGNDKVKNYLYHSKNILCKYDRKLQNEIIFNRNHKNNYLISHIYSNDFNNEIPSVNNMTLKNIEENNQYKFVEKKSFFNSIATFIFNLYLKYFMNVSLYSNINIIENTQSFFIPKNIRERIYQVPPHKKFSIGPIIFKPNKSGIIRATLFLKNNLTILYPLKLKGEGGGGIIKFIDFYKGKKKCKLFNENNLAIEIDENIYEKEIKGKDKFNRTIELMNIGNLPMVIKNMTIDNSNECQINNVRIVQCKEFILDPKESVNIDIEITPVFRNEVSNKIIIFNTEYQSFYLYIYIRFSKDFYESKNYLGICLKCLLIVLIIVTIMLYSLSKIINLIQKQRREMCETDSEKDENLIRNEIEQARNNDNDNENDQIGYNSTDNTYHKRSNFGKKNKANKKNNSSNNQKGELMIKNNNSNIINNNNINEKKEYQYKAKDNKANSSKMEEKIENENTVNNNNKSIKGEKNKENKTLNFENNDNKKDSNKKLNTEIDAKYNEIDKKKENKISTSSIPRSKRRKNKGSFKVSHKNEEKINSKLNDRIENNNENVSEEKNIKNEEKKMTSSQQRIKSNENKIIEYENAVNENYYNNHNYYNKYKRGKGRRDYGKKYYSNNRKYSTYDNSQNNYNNSTNTQQQQPKKQTIIKKKNNPKNLKELFEINNSKKTKTEDKNKKNESHQKDENENTNTNNVINENNLSNIKISNDEDIEDDFDAEILDCEKQLFFKSVGDKKEEMNPIFLSDIKTNKAFEAEQELKKSLKKDNKESNIGELSKEDIDMDLSNSNSHYNFDIHFFKEKKDLEDEFQSKNEESKFKTFFENLNHNENPFANEEQMGIFDTIIKDNSNKEESEDKKEDINEKENDNDNDNEDNIYRVNEYEQIFTSQKSDFNY